MKSSESPGRKKPMSSPVSAKMIEEQPDLAERAQRVDELLEVDAEDRDAGRTGHARPLRTLGLAARLDSRTSDVDILCTPGCACHDRTTRPHLALRSRHVAGCRRTRPVPKPLVIVESPAKAKTIEGFLGRDNVHGDRELRPRPRPAEQREGGAEERHRQGRARLGIDVDDHFEPVCVVPEKKKDSSRALKEALEGRERALPRHRRGPRGRGDLVARPRGAQARPACRSSGWSSTRSPQQAIEEAIANRARARHEARRGPGGPPRPRPALRLRDVARGPAPGRRRDARPGGCRASPPGSWSSASAQRMAFRAASYWDLEGTFAAARRRTRVPRARSSRSTASALASGRDFDPTTGAARRRRRRRRTSTRPTPPRSPPGFARRRRSRSTSVESKPLTERPKPPFTTTTLQQEAGRKLGFSAARTMSVAQRLYENGLHHLHAHRLDEPVGAGGQRGPRRRSERLRRRVPARRRRARTRAR